MQELTLWDGCLPSNAVSLRVSSCKRVTLTEGAILRPPFLRRVELQDLRDVAVHPHGLARPGDAAPEDDDRRAGGGPGTTLSLRRCNVSRLDSAAVRGRVDEVELRDCHVGGVAPYAFASLEGTERLRLLNCTFRSVEAMAFRRFAVAHVLVRGGAFPDGLPGRAFTDIDARRSFRLEGVVMGRLDTWAFVVGDGVGDFAVVDCRVERVQTHAFNVSVTGAVRVEGNSFASLADQAFGAVVADWRSRVAGDAREILFQDNAVADFDRGALDVGDGAGVFLTVNRLRVGRPCHCGALAEWAALLGKFRPLPLAPEELLCGDGERFVDFSDAHCGAASSDLWVVLGVAVPLGALLLAAPCVCLVLLRRRRRRKRGKVSFRPGPADGLVLPEAKTYRETELHVMLEKAEPLVDDRDPK